MFCHNSEIDQKFKNRHIFILVDKYINKHVYMNQKFYKDFIYVCELAKTKIAYYLFPTTKREFCSTGDSRIEHYDRKEKKTNNKLLDCTSKNFLCIKQKRVYIVKAINS